MAKEVIRPRVEIPQSGTITASIIRRAYLFGDRHAQRRIEEHGRLQRQTIKELIHREPSKPKASGS